MPISTNRRLADLTNALIDKTDDGTISWEKTSIDGVYSTALANYVIHIDEITSGESSAPDYRISLFNQIGEPIEEYRDTDLRGIRPEKFEGFFTAMEHLYGVAAGQASGVNDAIDDILKFLNG